MRTLKRVFAPRPLQSFLSFFTTFALIFSTFTPLLGTDFATKVRAATDNTVTAQTSNTTDHLWGVSFIDNDTGWAVGQSTGGTTGDVIKTTNGGTTWTVQTDDFPVLWRDIYMLDASVGFAVADNITYQANQGLGANDGLIFKTIDGGIGWSKVSEFADLVFYGVSAYQQGAAITVVAVGDSGKIRYSLNGGTSFGDGVADGITDNLRGVKMISTLVGYFTGAGGIAYETADGGENWTTADASDDLGTTDLEDIDAVSSSTRWVAGAGGVSYALSGGTWSAQSNNISDTIWAVDFSDVNNGWLAGNGGELDYTTDGGSTWTAEPSGVATPLRDIIFPVDNETGWAVGNAGVVLKITQSITPDDPDGPGGGYTPDITPPTSMVDPLPAYTNDTILTVTATASDPGGAGVSKVELWYRYEHWGSYQLFATDESPFIWEWEVPLTADGRWFFYSRAYDFANPNNYEAAPEIYDTSTILDTTPPTIVSTTPYHNEKNVGTGQPIVVNFSESINTATATYTVTPSLSGWTVDWNSTTTQLTLSHPTEPFAQSTIYTVKVTRAEDLAGNTLAPGEATNPWVFTTSDAQDPDLTNSAKTVDKDFAFAGKILTYSIHLVNTGSLTANVTFSDAIPTMTKYVAGSVVGGTYNATLNKIVWSGALAQNQTHDITFKVQIDIDAPVNTIINNYAIFDDGYNAPVTRSASTVVIDSLDFYNPNLTKFVDPGAVDNGDFVTYTLTIEPLTSEGGYHQLFDQLSEYFVYIEDSATGGAWYDPDTHSINWSGYLYSTHVITYSVFVRDTRWNHSLNEFGYWEPFDLFCGDNWDPHIIDNTFTLSDQNGNVGHPSNIDPLSVYPRTECPFPDLRLESHTPELREKDVALYAPIRLKFDGWVEKSDLHFEIKYLSPDGQRHNFDGDWQIIGSDKNPNLPVDAYRYFIIGHRIPFEINTRYEVRVYNTNDEAWRGKTSTRGWVYNNAGAPVKVKLGTAWGNFWYFDTGDTIPPDGWKDSWFEIAHTAPRNSEAAVYPNADIEVTFTEPVNTNSFSFNFSKLTDPTKKHLNLGWSWGWNADKTTVTLHHSTNFEFGVIYRVLVNATSASGDKLTEGLVPNPWNFLTIVPGIVITTSTFSIPTKQVSPTIIAELIDTYKRYVKYNVITATSLELRSTSTNGAFSRTSDFYPASNITIPEGESSASFYYRDTQTGHPSLSVFENPSQGWNDASQQVTIYDPEKPDEVESKVVKFTTGTYKTLIGNTTPTISVRFEYADGAPYILPEDRTFELSTNSVPGEFLQVRSTGNQIGSLKLSPFNTVTARAGSSGFDMYYRDFVAGAHNLTVADATDSGVGILGQLFRILAHDENNLGSDHQAQIFVENEEELEEEEEEGDEEHSLVIVPTVAILQPGERVDFTAQVYNLKGETLENVTYEWALVNGGGNLATTSNDTAEFVAGKLIGFFERTVKVTAYVDEDTTLSAYADVVVYDIIYSDGFLPATGFSQLQVILLFIAILSAIALAGLEHYEYIHFHTKPKRRRKQLKKKNA